MIELKPCPFCACAKIKLEEVVFYEEQRDSHIIQCPACSVGYEGIPADIIRKWNTSNGKMEEEP